MKGKVLASCIFAFSGCKTTHGFGLEDTKPVDGAEAPSIDVEVKSRIANLSGTTQPDSSNKVHVNEVGPSRSLLVDFDAKAFKKIVASGCDAKVDRLRIDSQSEKVAVVFWGPEGETDKYSARIEISDDFKYNLACTQAKP